jgi:hypothetical protein
MRSVLTRDAGVTARPRCTFLDGTPLAHEQTLDDMQERLA